MKEQYQEYFDTNQKTWDRKVAIHAASDFYNMEAFLNGKNTLNSYELEALGNVSGKSLLHLQCHFGQDTLSWSRMGAQCTGVDISQEAITLSRKLNKKLNLTANFICCNVLDTSLFVKKKFNLVFTSYGSIGWLPDLEPWGRMIAQRLEAGGTFYMVEFHPIVWMFDYIRDKKEMIYGYHQKGVIYEEYEGTYADKNSKIISREYSWNHGLGEIISALTKAGLKIDYLTEHTESPYNILPDLQQNKKGYYTYSNPLYPLIFELKATKI